MMKGLNERIDESSLQWFGHNGKKGGTIGRLKCMHGTVWAVV